MESSVQKIAKSEEEYFQALARQRMASICQVWGYPLPGESLTASTAGGGGGDNLVGSEEGCRRRLAAVDGGDGGSAHGNGEAEDGVAKKVVCSARPAKIVRRLHGD